MKNGDPVQLPFLPSERILENNFPVYWDYLYIVDGKVFRSDIQGTIMTLKRDLFKLGKIASIDVEVRTFNHQRLS